MVEALPLVAWSGGLPHWDQWGAWIALVALLGVAASPLGRRIWLGILRMCGRVGRHDVVGIGICAIVSLAVTSGAALVAEPARPSVHDEFSYVLAGETFARGRLTNPPHPMWRHLETVHVVQQPTYMSKYPPGQGMALALGIFIADEPAAGAWLATSVAVAAIAWMLYGWLPKRWAMLGGILAALHPLVLGWGWVLWGGAVALLGGALVAGAFRRIVRRPDAAMGVVLAVGLLILANTRPYEGVLVTLPVGIVLLARLVRRGGFIKVAVPAVVVLAVGAGAMGYYNWRVTGDALLMPYSLHDRTYAVAPHFVFQKAREGREFRHAALREFHGQWELGLWNEQQALSLWARRAAGKLLKLAEAALQPVFVVLVLAALPRALRKDRWLWVGLGTGACLAIGMLPVTWNFLYHYAAPWLGLWIVVAVRCLKELKSGWPEFGGVLQRVTAAGWLGVAAWAVTAQAQVQARGWEVNRQIIQAELEKQPGKDLVIVRYLPGHNVHVEWVYNSADVDCSEIVFAREMSERENTELMAYFKDRKVWLMEVDGEKVRMNPYPGK